MKKRGVRGEKADASGDGHKKARPLLLSEVREMRSAEETSLVRLEMDELMKRVRDREGGAAGTKEALFKLKTALEQGGDHRVTGAEASVFTSYNFANSCASLDFVAPKTVEVAGALLSDAVLRGGSFDMVAVLPSQLIKTEDRTVPRHYHDKRVLYLTQLAANVRHAIPGAIVTSENAFGGDVHKPVLNVKLPQLKTAVRVFAAFSPGSNKLPLAKLLPHVNGTPLLNCSIAEDTQLLAHAALLRDCIAQCSAARDALLLVKQWLKVGDCSTFFTGFHAGMLLCHLHASGKLSKLSNAYTVFRMLLVALADEATFSGGLFWPSEGSQVPEGVRQSFVSAFEVVFVDPSGVVNLTSRLSAAILAEVQEEARAALAAMDSRSLVSLFSSRAPFSLKWDQVVSLPSLIAPFETRGDTASYLGWNEAAIRAIADLLKRGLGTRCVAVSQRSSTMQIGIRLNASTAFRKLDAGPAADDKEKAAQFRKFWGSRAELRRFKDGSIIESVVWEYPFEERQTIPDHIVTHLLAHHFGIVPDIVRANQADALVSRSGDLASLHILNVFNDLAQKIRVLDGVPLAVNDVWALDAVLRCCAVFPPVENPFADGTAVAGTSRQSLAIDPIEFAVRYVSSSSWPADKEAMKQLQHAFRLKTRQELARLFQIASVLQEDSLDILYKGFVFRMRLFVGKEGGEYKKQLQLRSTHTSSILGFHMKHNAFGATARLCKRWLHAHLISSDKVPEEVVELTLVSVFQDFVPASPLTGFLRWLRLMATFPWDSEPLIVSINEATAVAESAIAAARETLTGKKKTGPFIVSEQDATSNWTRSAPSGAVWKRAVTLARHALNQIVDLNRSPTSVFVSNFSDYDLVLNLSPLTVPNYWQNIGQAMHSCAPISHVVPAAKNLIWTVAARKYRRDNSELLIGFSPVQSLVSELNSRFGLVAQFFFDENGGDRIGVVLKRSRIASPFAATNLSNLICSKPSAEKEMLEFNRDQFISAVRALAADMLLSISSKK